MFDRQSAHNGVIRTELNWRDVEFGSILQAGFRQAFSENGIGGNSTAHAKSRQIALVNGQHGLSHEAVYDGCLKTGGHICNLLLGELQ